ncbi:MAG: hypothetical protein MUP74_03740 [Desulfobacterales bacterium]|nr:hypothetical protein [Desulfobacterales bacterium]
MSIARKLGIVVFCGVPDFVGGGFLFGVYGSYVPVVAFETILLLQTGALVNR